jgi:hypothetical protein
MSYESGTNGLGVGQRYGEREVGNVQGVTCATSGEGRMVFEFDGTDAAALAAQSFSIPEGFAAITSVLVEVEAVFTSGSVDVEIDGADAGGTAKVLTSLGMSAYALTANPTPLTAAQVVTVAPDAALVAAAAGSYAKVIVEFARV